MNGLFWYIRKWLVLLIAGFVILTAGNGWATASKAETRAWESACTRFQEAASPMLFSLADSKFVEFLAKFPETEHYGEAIVYRARALYSQGRYEDAINLLALESEHAGNQADKFRYWTAMSYFKMGDFLRAADNFARLTRENQDSLLRPEAFYMEAEAHSRLGLWQKVVEDLGEKDGAFQKFALGNPSDDRVMRGWLLLAEAQLKLKDFDSVERTLSIPGSETWKGEFAWQRQMLLCTEKLSRGEPEKALSGTTNLLFLAEEKPELRARSILLQGQIFETLGRLNEAVQAYRSNLSAALSPERRKDSLLQMVELMLRQENVAEADKLMEDFCATSTNECTGNLMVLLRGELSLKRYFLSLPLELNPTNAIAAASTNAFLLSASDNFQRVIDTSTNGVFKGKAELSLGWCRFEAGRITESQVCFSNALKYLPPSEDRAVAQFKLGDIAFRLGFYDDALAAYRAVLAQTNLMSMAASGRELFGRALYQIVRTGLQSSNMVVAVDAMKKILAEHPDGQLAERSSLLVSQAQSPSESRATLSDLITRFPQSELIPQLKLAMAQSYEREGDWSNAVQRLQLWVSEFPTNQARPQVDFLLAKNTSKAGSETNAYSLFTNYVAVYQTNAAAKAGDYPALAQYWIGDFFWGLEDYQKAGIAYEEVYKKWPESPLAYRALMMAGRSAFQRQSPQEARSYFTNLTSNPNCPSEVKQQALFGLGDAIFSLATPSNLTNYYDALEVFDLITRNYANSPIAARARGRMGDCYYAFAGIQTGTTNAPGTATDQALVAYGNARTNYSLAMESPEPDVRGMAEKQLGDTLASMARLTAEGSERTNLFRSALDHYLNVFDGANQLENQVVDPFWVKEAGRQAAELAEELGEGRQALAIYRRLIKAMPSLKISLEKKMSKIQQGLNNQRP